VPDANRKEDHIELTEYPDFTDACGQVGCFHDQIYQYKRLPSAFGNPRPAGFEHLRRLKPAKPELWEDPHDKEGVHYVPESTD